MDAKQTTTPDLLPIDVGGEDEGSDFGFVDRLPGASGDPAAIKALASGMGLPSVRRESTKPPVTHAPVPAPAPKPETPTATTTLKAPEYLLDDLRIVAAKRRVTMNYLILEALKAQGYHIAEADLHVDGRRKR